MLSARGERAKKISPVKSGNLQPNQHLEKIITGHNRRLFSALCRRFMDEFARNDSHAVARPARHANARTARALSVSRCVPMPSRLSSKRAFLRGKTSSMARIPRRAIAQDRASAK
jgi:hypothetical protein